MSAVEESEEELYDMDWTHNDPFFDYNDPFALSPQFTAVLANDVRRLKRLIKSGKSANITDNKGSTPLHVAVIKDKSKVFKYLLTLDQVRIDAQNFEGDTPLLLALLCHNEYFALKLINKGADINKASHNGYTPLHYAASNSMKVGRILIQKGADIDARNYNGETPLFIACERGNSDIIQMLLYYGANVDIPNYQGVLPFTLVLSTCPRYLQDMFFDYTFDEEKIPVDLGMLTTAMKTNSYLFPRIVEKTSQVLYDKADLEELSHSLPYIKINVFRVFLQKFEEVVEDMLTLCPSLEDYLNFMNCQVHKKRDCVDFFYMLCESPAIACVAEKYEPKLPLVDTINHPDVTEDTFTKLMCCLLSWGIDITSEDLDAVYKRYGYCDLFKIMLHMDFVCCKREGSRYCRAGRFWMSAVFYDVNLDNDRCLFEPEKYIDYSDFEKLFRFFALPKLREADLNTPDGVVTMPSLLELARNAARKYIIQRYNVRKCVHFYTILKGLPICDVYKAILSYEKELY